MKKSTVTALFFGLFLGSASYADSVKNVLVGPGIFPTEPSEFIKCMAKSSLSGSQLQFLGLGKVNLLASDNSRIEIQFLAKDTNGKTGFFKIIANSTDQENGWQKISADADGNKFYFSKSVASVGLVMQDGSPEAAVFDFSSCQN